MKKVAKAMYGKSMMKKGGTSSKMKKYKPGGAVSDPGDRFKKRQERKIAKAETRSKIAEIEGEGTVKDKRDNRANRITKVAGTGRQKTPKSVSTSTSTSTSNTDNRNSGNTNYNTNNNNSSSSSSNSESNSESNSGPRSNGRINKTNKKPVPKMKMGGAKPKAMYGMSMKPRMMKKGGAKKK